MKNFTVLLDNGHGADTPGKCSPDGLHREWEWCRRMTVAIERELEARGTRCCRIVPEDADVPLRERSRRANAIAATRRSLLVSIHNNASGDGRQWRAAHGWSCYVAPRASPQSRRMAQFLTAEAVSRGLTGNRRTPPEGYWTADFAICRDTVCPAVLTENMFQDNAADVGLLASPEGFDAIVALHVAAILKFCKES